MIGIWLLVMSILDIRKRTVPVWLLVLGGILAAISVCQQNAFLAMGMGMLPGIGLLLIAFLTKKAGYGDGIVLVILGMVSGGGESLLIFSISLFLSAIFSMVLLVLRKAGRNTRIPFLPFLTIGWLLVAVL